MNSLEKQIISRITEHGPITFSEFMETALYEPELGYYTSGDTEIGRDGDFYTSPHLHPVFGALVGRQAEECWEIMGRPRDFQIIEPGGGRGYLAKDMLDYLKDSAMYESITYTLIEPNPHMKKRQEAMLREHGEKIKWASSLRDVKVKSGLILSNEVLDALPVHVIEMQDELKEIYVTIEGDRIKETTGPPSDPAIEEYLEEFSIGLTPGYRTEVNLRMKDWLGQVSEVLQEGFLLSIDYGYPAPEYYSEERDRGTLLCYHKHTVNENPYIHVGEQDITAHVNFSALKKWGEDLGLQCMGFSRQGAFLVSLGIDEMITDLYGAPNYETEVSKIKGLILPGTMGDTHKVMVQYRGKGAPSLRGFEMKNQVDSL
jgi:SAM-dependent MidA family methyltransferase